MSAAAPGESRLTPAAEPSSGAPPEDFRQLVYSSLLTGLCPLIPLPLADDWARDVLRRRLVRDLAASHGVGLAAGETRILACGHHPPTAGGCLFKLVVLVVKPVFKLIPRIFKKVFRKVFLFLTARDCVVTFSDTFHQGYLVRHAAKTGALAGEAPPALGVRRAIEAAVAEPDHRPIEQLARRAFRGSWRLLKRSARQLAGAFRRLRRRGRDGQHLLEADLRLEDEERLLGSLVDELTEELLQETGYLRQLETLFAQHLAAADGTPGHEKVS